jgi:hypothetical protein
MIINLLLTAGSTVAFFYLCMALDKLADEIANHIEIGVI